MIGTTESIPETNVPLKLMYLWYISLMTQGHEHEKSGFSIMASLVLRPEDLLQTSKRRWYMMVSEN